MSSLSQRQHAWQPIHGISFASNAQSNDREDSTASMDARDNSDPRDEYPLTLAEEDDLLRAALAIEATEDIAVDFQDLTLSDSSEIPSLDEQWQPEYRIPAEVLQNSLNASEDSTQRYWSYRKYRDVHGKAPTVHYCTNFETAEAQAATLLDEPVLGFDLEWEMMKGTASEANIKRAVSVVQIASESKIVIFHISQFKGSTREALMPPSLLKILTSPGSIKAGVNVAGDMRRVNTCFNMTMQGLFELSHMWRQVKHGADAPHLVSKKLVRLDEQVVTMLGLPLEKGAERTTSWQEKMTTRKSDYAASDAYAGYQVFRALDEKRKAMTDAPSRPAFLELGAPIPLPGGSISDAEGDEDEPEINPTRPSRPRKSSQGAAAIDNELDHQAEEDVKRFNNPTEREPSPELDRASVWASDYRAALAEPDRKLVGEADLRAYHLWHVQQMDLSTTASIMRAEPLRPSTIARYVCKSIYHFKLPCDMTRLEQLTGHLSMYDKKYSKVPVATQVQTDSREQL